MRALFAATFDPATNGHLDLIARSAAVHAEVVAGSIRAAAIAHAVFHGRTRRVAGGGNRASAQTSSVRDYRGLTVDFARDIEASVLVRGLRAVSDFEYEFALSAMNRRLAPELDTVFFRLSPRACVREFRRWCGRSVPLAAAWRRLCHQNVATAVAAKYGDASPRR